MAWVVPAGLRINVTSSDAYAFHVEEVYEAAGGTMTNIAAAARLTVTGDLHIKNDAVSQSDVDL